MKDRFHIGEEAAEAQGTWNRGFGRRQMREEEEQEIQDEADSLVDQRRPGAAPGLPGIQSAPQPDGPGFLPGIGGAQPPPPAGMPGAMGGMDPGRLAAIMSQGPPQSGPPPNPAMPGLPPMLPGMGGPPPMNMDLGQLQKQLAAQGFQMPPNMNFQNMAPGSGGLPGLQGGGMPDGRR